MGQSIEKRLEHFKEELMKVREENRNLRKRAQELEVSRDSWKQKHSDKQYQLKIQKSTTQAFRESRDRWQRIYEQKSISEPREATEQHQIFNEMQVQLQSAREELETLKKEFEESKKK